MENPTYIYGQIKARITGKPYRPQAFCNALRRVEMTRPASLWRARIVRAICGGEDSEAVRVLRAFVSRFAPQGEAPALEDAVAGARWV